MGPEADIRPEQDKKASPPEPDKNACKWDVNQIPDLNQIRTHPHLNTELKSVSFLLFWGREGYSLHKCNDNNLKMYVLSTINHTELTSVFALHQLVYSHIGVRNSTTISRSSPTNGWSLTVIGWGQSMALTIMQTYSGDKVKRNNVWQVFQPMLGSYWACLT